MTTGTVKLEDSELQYFSDGEGEPVILLAGAGLTVDYLKPFTQLLAEAGIRVVRINLRGAGESTGPKDTVTLHSLAADIAGVVEDLKLGPVHLIGHAGGNRVARMLTADRPELVRSVVLLAAGGMIRPSEQVERTMSMLRNPAASDAERMEAFKCMVSNATDVKSIWSVIKPCRSRDAAAILSQALSATPLSDWWAPEGLHRFLVLQGADDEVAPPENGLRLKQELGERVTVVNIAKAGHLLVLEQPEIVAGHVIAFLRPEGLAFRQPFGLT